MSVLTQFYQRVTPSYVASPRGWIGIDIGTQAIKLAQVERRSGQYVICNRWMVNPPDEPFSEASLTQGILASKALRLRGVRKLFTQSACATSLSMSFLTIRSLELPAASREEMRDMVREELADDETNHAQDYVFDFWTTKEQQDATSEVSALSMPTSLATRVAKDLLRGGFECEVLDGLPWAMARAVSMASDDEDTPVAALDLGESQLTFVLVVQGKPVFTRVLRGGGMRTLVQPLRDALKLSHVETMQLLRRYAVAAGEGAGRPPANGPGQALDQPLTALTNELQRTLSYVSGQFFANKPTSLVLFGGGAAVRNLPIYLTENLGFNTRVWSLPATPPEDAADDALFGVAAALSILRWEQSSCM